MQLLLFGYAINTDPKRLDAALLALGQDHYTRAIVSALEVSDYYRFATRPRTDAEAEALIQGGDVAFLVIVPSDFGARVDRGDKPQILVEADATDPSAASNAIGALGDSPSRALLREQGREAERRRRRRSTIVVHRRYNPDGISQYFVVPGLLGVILQMTMMMMTSVALTREIERGTMENLLAMPATGMEIMLGKVLPFFIVGAVQVTVILSAARFLFGVPFVGKPRLPARRRAGVRAADGAARLRLLDVGALADAGDATHLLRASAVDPDVGLHVPVPRHAGLGALHRRRAADDAFPARRARDHAEGRELERNRLRVRGARGLRARLLDPGAVEIQEDARLIQALSLLWTRCKS